MVITVIGLKWLESSMILIYMLSAHRVKLLRPVSQCRWRRTLPGVRSPAPHSVWRDKVETNCKFLQLVTLAVSNLQNHKHFCHWHTLRSRLSHVDDENLLSRSFRRMSFSFSGSWWCIFHYHIIISVQIFMSRIQWTTHTFSIQTSSHCSICQKKHLFNMNSQIHLPKETSNTNLARTMLCLGEELLSQEEVTCVAVHLIKRTIKTPIQRCWKIGWTNRLFLRMRMVKEDRWNMKNHENISKQFHHISPNPNSNLLTLKSSRWLREKSPLSPSRWRSGTEPQPGKNQGWSDNEWSC